MKFIIENFLKLGAIVIMIITSFKLSAINEQMTSAQMLYQICQAAIWGMYSTSILLLINILINHVKKDLESSKSVSNMNVGQYLKRLNKFSSNVVDIKTGKSL